MHARQADVAGAPRQRTLDARVLGIGRHELGAVLARSARHQRFIGVLGAYRDGLPVVFLDGMDTVGALGAGATVFGRELDLDDLILPIVDRRRPTDARPAQRAGGLRARPIDRGVDALARLGLPAQIGPDGPVQLHPVVPLARGQQRAVEVAGIEERDPGQEIVLLQAGREERRQGTIGGGARGTRDVRDQVGEVRLARLGDVDLVADPRCGACLGVVGIGIVGRTDQTRRRGRPWASVRQCRVCPLDRSSVPRPGAGSAPPAPGAPRWGPRGHRRRAAGSRRPRRWGAPGLPGLAGPWVNGCPAPAARSACSPPADSASAARRERRRPGC